MGHIRDLPKSTLGVDVEHDFAPSTSIPRDKSSSSKSSKRASEHATRVYPGDRPRPRGRGDRLAPGRGDRRAGQAGPPGRVPRDHAGSGARGDGSIRARSTWTSSMRSRRGAYSTGWSATGSARCSGRRSSAASPPDACSPRRCGSWSSASGRSRRSSRSNTGRSMPIWRTTELRQADATFRAALHRIGGEKADLKTDERPSDRRGLTARPIASRRSPSASRNGDRRRRSRPARCSRRRRASSATAFGGRCRSRRSSTRASTSARMARRV